MRGQQSLTNDWVPYVRYAAPMWLFSLVYCLALYAFGFLLLYQSITAAGERAECFGLIFGFGFSVLAGMAIDHLVFAIESTDQGLRVFYVARLPYVVEWDTIDKIAIETQKGFKFLRVFHQRKEIVWMLVFHYDQKSEIETLMRVIADAAKLTVYTRPSTGCPTFQRKTQEPD